MPVSGQIDHAAGGIPRRLYHFNAGFLNPRLRRILALAGHELRLGLPGNQDAVAVWGRSPYARRGEFIAARRGAALVRVEDAFLRSVRPGRMGDPTLGLMLDGRGVHFDGSVPSDLEHLLATHPLNDPNLLARSSAAIARIKSAHLSKYNIFDPNTPCPDPGYILVVDQTQGDASVRYSGAGDAAFAEMLAAARDENPGATILIKTHPETALGLRAGHYGPKDGNLFTAPVSPWRLLEGAAKVYTLSSQLGFEAILAGHRPRVFGRPFYAGWGLSDDALPMPRRGRQLTPEQLFAAAMILAPLWYDPCRDQLCTLETVLDQLEAETRCWREDHRGHVALGMRMWKRARLQAVFGRYKPLKFIENAADLPGDASLLVWAGNAPQSLAAPVVRRVEDGFLRSRGLGAELVPPLSLVADDLGIYYDPTRPSRLENLILQGPPPGGRARAAALVAGINAAGISKYNLGGAGLPDLRPGKRILIPGQVEDDASIRLGAGEVRGNLALIRTVREAEPDAVLIYKPHPDVEAGLRPGRIAPQDLAQLVDHIAERADPATLLTQVDELWTITSLLGFEALLRGKPVTCLGAPFYAGWGLTRDLGPVPERRLRDAQGKPGPRPDIDALAHAVLIAYPRYYDPLSRRPCPPELVLERLQTGNIPRAGLAMRLLAKAQGRLASHANLWR